MSLLAGSGTGLPGGKTPGFFQNLMLATAKQGAASAAPLEVVVCAGRTYGAWRREGFIEAQERITDEVATAFVWLFGVTTLAQWFEKHIKPRLFPGTAHLSGDVAWSKPWGRPSNVDFRPQEMLARNAGDLRKLMLIKSGRLIFSVFIALSLVGYVIPRLNQMKTRWFLKRQKARQDATRQHEAVPQKPAIRPTVSLLETKPLRPPAPPSNTAVPPEAMSGVGGSLNPAWQSPVSPQALAGIGSRLNPAWQSPGFSTPLFAPFPSPAPRPTVTPFSVPPDPGFPQGAPPLFSPIGWPVPAAATVPLSARPYLAGPLRFGGLMSLANGAMQGLGSLIEQTTFGSLLVVDTVITGGRAATAYTRVPGEKNPFESLEFIVRDGLSMYCYMLAQPNCMWVLGKLLDERLGTCLALQPEITATIHRELERRIGELAERQPALKVLLEKGEIPAAALQEMIHGPRQYEQALLHPMPWLEREMRQGRLAGDRGFLPLLSSELAAMAPPGQPASLTEGMYQAIAEFLKRRQSGRVATQDVQALLAAIDKRQGAFQGLSDVVRADLTIAVKSAFRHTAGLEMPLSAEGVHAFKPLAEALEKLPANEQAALTARILRAAHLDGLGQANTMFRRGLNLARPHLTDKHDLLKRADAVADWLDKSTRMRLDIADTLAADVEDILALLPADRVSASLREVVAAPGNKLTAQHLPVLSAALNGLSGRKARQASESLAKLKTLVGDVQTDVLLADAVRSQAEKTFRELSEALSGGFSEPVRKLLQHYNEAIPAYLHGRQGRLISLYVPEATKELYAHLHEMLLGGLKYDYPLTRRAQKLIGQFAPDSRSYAGSGKRMAMREDIRKYLLQLSNKIEQTGEHISWKPMLERFWKINRNTHYACRLGSFALAAVGVGLLVPALQNAMTRHLTGHNENPGIAQARQALGLDRPQDGPPKGAEKPSYHSLPSSQTGAPLSRHNFEAFHPSRLT